MHGSTCQAVCEVACSDSTGVQQRLTAGIVLGNKSSQQAWPPHSSAQGHKKAANMLWLK